ncbi:hypothetical protein phiCbK_285 [Caulobacter phage phiCbK]|uniref:Uncharacterized protein n=5 Tax=Viruses TaxID=10239 RepID=J3SVW6_9CAUD|nr:hypothetical protein D865_gp034 [Caulobacter phage phiCbK]AFO71801.1 hypothetical protein phiCbK_285 [Caulobacter phage phiCbK]AFU86866.1 hypothetical protein CbK_gp034 [Caulobacter phage phiCbK]ARB14953.1 hypothetical protein Ccr32_gp034 [Caulobacter phage Ccr32]ARB15284.1 hypothetical protein Ccr34_gp035 [Caulobacter phage Ccr34]
MTQLLPDTLYVTSQDLPEGPVYSATTQEGLSGAVRYTRFDHDQHIKAAQMLLAGATIHEAHGQYGIAAGLKAAVTEAGVNIVGEATDILKAQELTIAQMRRQRNDLLVANNHYLADARAARAGEPSPPVTPEVADAIRAIGIDALQRKAKDYLEDYEYRGEFGTFQPGPQERIVLDDLLQGFLALITEA